MIPALPRQGQHGGTAFVIIEHDPAQPLRPQRDRLGEALPILLGPTAGLLRRTPGQRPTIDGAGHIGCSIAHCGPASLLSVAPGRELGADLEAVRPELPLDDVVDTFFTKKEQRWLHGLSAAKRPLGTTLLWTAKEAWLKLIGVGITAGLRTPALDGLDLSTLIKGTPKLGAEGRDGLSLLICQGSLAGSHHVMAIASRSNATS